MHLAIYALWRVMTYGTAYRKYLAISPTLTVQEHKLRNTYNAQIREYILYFMFFAAITFVVCISLLVYMLSSNFGICTSPQHTIYTHGPSTHTFHSCSPPEKRSGGLDNDLSVWWIEPTKQRRPHHRTDDVVWWRQFMCANHSTSITPLPTPPPTLDQ